jgi:16S rRNA (adenine1518-N6/adenine1519-N6)-dimethyltransferase
MSSSSRVSSLATPGATAEVLRRFGIRPRKRFGQHFLISQRALDRILEAADLSPGDSVLEIGAGLGTLTTSLAQRAGSVIAVEVDEGLIPALRMAVSHYPNVQIVHADILELMEEGRGKKEEDRLPSSFDKVVANLPYNVASVLIVKLVETPLGLSRMVLTVQREVAARLAASPGTKAYGALSVAVQFRATVQVVDRVPATAFYPPPDVESAIVRIDVRARPAVNVTDERRFFAVVRAAFGQRRKTLRNALTGLGIRPAAVAEACLAAGIDPQRRGETLSLQEFAALSAKVTPS